MEPSSRTPEGEPNYCPVCGNTVRMEPSSGFRDAPCPHCGHLLLFPSEHKEEARSPDKRKRLQKCFEYASKQTAEENYDYATELLAQCVLGDPGNLIYAQNFISNLQKKYRHNKKGSRLARFKERGARTALKKASSIGDWDEAIKNGIAVLKVNPWDVPTLTAMASASTARGFDECKLYYLRCALEINPKDPDVNRLYAIALEKRGQVDQAIARWHREEQDRPGDE